MDFPFIIKENKIVPKESHSYTLASFLNKDLCKTKSPNDRIEVLKDTVARMISETTLPFSEVMKEVSKSNDVDSISVLNRTDETTRKYLQSFLYFCGRFEINSIEAPIHKSATAIVTFALDHLLYHRVYELIVYPATGTAASSALQPPKSGMSREQFIRAFEVLNIHPGEDVKEVS
jgi:hypothetical protein